MTTQQIENAATKATEITKSVVTNSQSDINSTSIFLEVFARLLAVDDVNTDPKPSES